MGNEEQMPEKIAAQIDTMQTIEEVEGAKADLVLYWKGVEEQSQGAKLAAAIYAKLILKGNALKQPSPALKGDAVEGMAQAETVMKEVSASGMLSVTVDQIGPVVKVGHAHSLEEVLATICAVQRQMILDKYAADLAEPVRAAFLALLDDRIAMKIKNRLKGVKGTIYQKAYADATLKYQGQTAPAMLAEPVSAPKHQTKKTKKKTAFPSVWQDVTQALVVVPANASTPLQGKAVSRVSTHVMELMNAYVEEERTRWKTQGVECSDLILRHNFLTMLLNEGAEHKILLQTSEVVEGVCISLTGEQVGQPVAMPLPTVA